MLLSARLSRAPRKPALPSLFVMSILPEFIIQRRGLVAMLIPELARKIAPMGRRSLQFTWNGYLSAYRFKTSPDRSWTREPPAPKRSETLKVLVMPGLMPRQVIVNG